MPRAWKRERRAVYATDLALLAIVGGLGLLLGFQRVAAVQLPVIAAASMIGVWLFSVQHRFEHALWARHERWTFASAALRGSSYLRLPALLQWFTGNIGFHHVHHLNPRIPNYRLEECHEGHSALRAVPALTLRGALTAWRYTLWDEDQDRMVGFR
jgi:omega-6 fatty acid desaturase (delta-12 desaturase)